MASLDGWFKKAHLATRLTDSVEEFRAHVEQGKIAMVRVWARPNSNRIYEMHPETRSYDLIHNSDLSGDGIMKPTDHYAPGAVPYTFFITGSVRMEQNGSAYLVFVDPTSGQTFVQNPYTTTENFLGALLVDSLPSAQPLLPPRASRALPNVEH